MLILKVKTAFDIGLLNVFRVVAYRLKAKFGFVLQITNLKQDTGDFFAPYTGKVVSFDCNKQWLSKQTYFDRIINSTDKVPDWHFNYLTGTRVGLINQHWSQIDDFDDSIGDIKGIWEASRLSWVISFAQAIKSGESSYLMLLNRWLIDWEKQNPAFSGVNWKCGQEASIRVLHIATCALLLSQSKKSSSRLLNFVEYHLQRIFNTFSYAIAQDNNHGTSEAAALYVGGSWLVLNGREHCAKYANIGAKTLEERALRLIASDGSFSQQSVNYHRMLIDTYAFVEIWRQKHHLPSWDARVKQSLSSATLWLYYLTQISGDAPNLGANDGSRIFPLTDTDYRDFRPTVQLAANIFLEKSAYLALGTYDLPLDWFEIDKASQPLPSKTSQHYEQGGYYCLIHEQAFVLLNYPNYQFRPSQCDALHLDFWVEGKNIFRDGGSYSYNAGEDYILYYGGTESHNTVQFDSRDQMPRVSRFMLANWLKTTQVGLLEYFDDVVSCEVGYKDDHNCHHTRKVELSLKTLCISDHLFGFNKKAVIRWRLIPDNRWHLVGNVVSNEEITITISANVDIERIEILEGKESRYYYQETPLPVLEIEVSKNANVITKVSF